LDSVIVDVGCGLGHFYDYLQEIGYKGVYIGIDANPKFISVCRSKYPGVHFKEGLVSESIPAADFAVASGLLNRKFENSDALVRQVFLAFQRGVRMGFALNFLHAAALKKYDQNHYTEISALESLVDRSLLSGFTVDANTLPGEFTFAGYIVAG
jgi:SAM-dependent methyltransferase